MIGGASGCGLCPWSSSRKVGAYARFIQPAVGICSTWAALPQFSWDTLPVFFHSANSTGQYNDDALKVIAKFQMATIEKSMGYDIKNVDDEDEMVIAMKAIKAVNPKTSIYFYMNSRKDQSQMTRMI